MLFEINTLKVQGMVPKTIHPWLIILNLWSIQVYHTKFIYVEGKFSSTGLWHLSHVLTLKRRRLPLTSVKCFFTISPDVPISVLFDCIHWASFASIFINVNSCYYGYSYRKIYPSLEFLKFTHFMVKIEYNTLVLKDYITVLWEGYL